MLRVLVKLILLFIWFSSPFLYANNQNNNIMGPLWLSSSPEFQDLKNDLEIAKNIGINAVTIDVWWGAVEKSADQSFDWSYYDKVFNLIESKDLKIIPIMSFHQCGGNVGDDCNIKLPKWIWSHFKNIENKTLMYKSEQGNYSKEYISLWADTLIMSQYIEFMQAFKNHFKHKAHLFDEINISMGPAGELRYPSYNSHDNNSGYPTRGSVQSYGKLAVEDFQQNMKQKYHTIKQLNEAWEQKYTKFNHIKPPEDMAQFISKGKHLNTQFGKDYFSWYHQALIDHGTRILQAADIAFNDTFSDIQLGYKVAGIHWLMAKNGHLNRAAEIASGIIPANLASTNSGLSYQKAISIAKKGKTVNRQVVLHFTCLEMSDNPTAPAYSKAQTLVNWISKEANKQNVIIKGENALAAGILNNHGWNNIETAFEQGIYSGLTILRLNNTRSKIVQKRYAEFIKK
ncbi:family 14 glycosylhydrolase [Pseudoalteromonas sp. C2R02]|uniref:family 14 glycosylhydrolase n=1 Tax=Pseudoalteromonas sp. C2R02 TaxID=2841565 RepID=UPI001C098A87|nr:family 14 glycosylhydrolase [Pseudoalteromonas sp. C2R02]MBU2972106.1 family 14 glycosylhydrolase [Pseudoalteromonas sp. C2R02]